MSFVTRAYNSIVLGPDGNTLIKSSSDSKLIDEIEYYRNLPDSLKLYFARFISGIKYDDYARLELEYYAYGNLGDAMINHGRLDIFWHKVFAALRDYIKTYQMLRLPSSSVDNFLMFVRKTEVEHQKLGHDRHYIFNGRPLKAFSEIWPRLREFIESSCLAEDYSYLIHGDLCFSNILVGEHPATSHVVLKMIDPRGSYGSGLYGSVYYDLAKLYHSINGGYEYLINNRYLLSNENNVYSLAIHQQGGSLLKRLFCEYFEEYNLEKVKLLEGLLYISMCYRHQEDPKRQMAMYLTGLDILNNTYESL